MEPHPVLSPSAALRVRRAAPRWAAAAAVAVLAFGLRLLPAQLLWSQGRLLLFQADTDPCEHARRVELTLEHYPAVPEFDGFAGAPEGASAIWSPVTDLLAAAAVRRLYGPAPVREQLERFYLYAPPVLGAATAGLLTAGLWASSPPAALWSGLALALLPGHRAYSLSARFDHHVLEAAFALLYLLLLLAAARRREKGGAGTAPALGAGLALAALAAVWGGGLALWALMGAGLLAASWEEGAWPWTLTASALAFVFIAWVTGSNPDAPPLAFAHDKWLVAGIAVLLAAASWLLRAWRGGRDGRVPANGMLGLGLLAAGLAAALLIPAAQRLQSFFGVGSVLPEWRYYLEAPESFPLWKDPLRLWTMLGPAAVLAPYALWKLERFEPWPPSFRGQLAVFATAAWLLSLLKARYMYFGALGLACLEGVVFAAWWGNSRLELLKRAGIAALAFLILHGRELRSPAAALRLDAHRNEALSEGYAYLAARTPEVPGFDDPALPAEPAVFCDWSIGHDLKYRARRPVTADAMGRGTVFQEQALGVTDDAAFWKLMDEHRVGWLFLTPMPFGPDSTAERLYFHPERPVPGFRLVFVGSQLRTFGGGRPTAAVKIYAIDRPHAAELSLRHGRAPHAPAPARPRRLRRGH